MDKLDAKLHTQQVAMDAIDLQDFLELAAVTQGGRRAIAQDSDAIRHSKDFPLFTGYDPAEIIDAAVAESLSMEDFPKTRVYLGLLVTALTGKVSYYFDERVYEQKRQEE